MQWVKIAENYWVSGQLSEEDIKSAASEGFEIVICNRPDGESDDQVPSDVIRNATEDLGMQFLFLPIIGQLIPETHLIQTQQILSRNKKVLAYCRSGKRSSTLYNQAMQSSA